MAERMTDERLTELLASVPKYGYAQVWIELGAELSRARSSEAALKEETLSLLNKPELPLRIEDWSFGHGRVGWHPEGEGWWLIAVAGETLIWAKRRAPARAELPTLTEEP